MTHLSTNKNLNLKHVYCPLVEYLFPNFPGYLPKLPANSTFLSDIQFLDVGAKAFGNKLSLMFRNLRKKYVSPYNRRIDA